MQLFDDFHSRQQAILFILQVDDLFYPDIQNLNFLLEYIIATLLVTYDAIENQKRDTNQSRINASLLSAYLIARPVDTGFRNELTENATVTRRLPNTQP